MGLPKTYQGQTREGVPRQSKDHKKDSSRVQTQKRTRRKNYGDMEGKGASSQGLAKGSSKLKC